MKTIRVQAHIVQPTGTNHNILVATTHCNSTNATITLDDMDYEPVRTETAHAEAIRVEAIRVEAIRVETGSPDKAPEYNDESDDTS